MMEKIENAAVVVENDDLLDEALMNAIGTRKTDAAKDSPKAEKPVNNQVKSACKKNTKTHKAVMDANYECVDVSNAWVGKLKECVKGTILFGGLSLLFFYWQQTGQMLQSASFPSIIVCTLLTGYWIGKSVGK